jgi:four helix bundle protein
MASGAKRFEDVIAWQKSRVFAVEIYRVAHEGRFSRDFVLRDQICRAAISVMSNIAEGFERGRPLEYRHFLSIAKASLAEVRSQLYLAKDLAYLNTDTADCLLEQSEELLRVIGGLRNAVERSLHRS